MMLAMTGLQIISTPLTGLWWPLTTTVILLSLVYWFLTKRRMDSNPLPPGPMWWPVIGCLPQFTMYIYWYGMKELEILDYLKNAYGKIFCFKILSSVFVIANDTQLIKAALKDPNLNDRPQAQLANQITGLYWKCWGDGVKNLRRLLIAGTSGKVGCDESSLEENIRMECVSLCNSIASLDGKQFKAHGLFRKGTLNVMLSTIFGKKVVFPDENMEELVEKSGSLAKLLGTSGGRLYVNVWSIFPSKKVTEIIQVSDDLKEFIEKHMILGRKTMPNDSSDFIDVLINKLRNPDDDNAFSSTPVEFDREEVLRNILMIVTLAGFDTTAWMISRMVQFMVVFPDVQRRIQQEIDEVGGGNRDISLADRRKCRYTNAVILEMMRFVGGETPTFVRAAGKMTTVGGFAIPQGSIFIPQVGAVHHDPNLWSDPYEFIPERFMQDNNNKDREPRKDLMMFGFGGRRCVGEVLAKMEIFIFLTGLLRHFNVSLPEGAEMPNATKLRGNVAKWQDYEAVTIRMQQRA